MVELNRTFEIELAVSWLDRFDAMTEVFSTAWVASRLLAVRNEAFCTPLT